MIKQLSGQKGSLLENPSTFKPSTKEMIQVDMEEDEQAESSNQPDEHQDSILSHEKESPRHPREGEHMDSLHTSLDITENQMQAKNLPSPN